MMFKLPVLAIWLLGNLQGHGYEWGYFAGEARKISPHLPFITAIPKEPAIFQVV
jgi:hypothetical protein